MTRQMFPAMFIFSLNYINLLSLHSKNISISDGTLLILIYTMATASIMSRLTSKGTGTAGGVATLIATTLKPCPPNNRSHAVPRLLKRSCMIKYLLNCVTPKQIQRRLVWSLNCAISDAHTPHDKFLVLPFRIFCSHLSSSVSQLGCRSLILRLFCIMVIMRYIVLSYICRFVKIRSSDGFLIFTRDLHQPF